MTTMPKTVEEFNALMKAAFICGHDAGYTKAMEDEISIQRGSPMMMEPNSELVYKQNVEEVVNVDDYMDVGDIEFWKNFEIIL